METSTAELPGLNDPIAHSPRVVAVATLLGPICLAPAALEFHAPRHTSQWVAFAILLAAATVSSWDSAPWHVVRRNAGFQGILLDLSDVFVIAGVLMLPPLLAALTSAGSFLLTWRRNQVPVYKIAFNVSMYIACSVAGSEVFHTLPHHGQAAWLLAGGAGAVSFLVVNMLLSLVARYAMRGIPLASPRDLVNHYPWFEQSLCAGCAMLLAALWRVAPLYEVLAVLPVATLYRVLWFREVQLLSQSDRKTGLFNVGYFAEVAEKEIARAERNHYPLSLILADLDDLRAINNGRGHLAGDAAIRAVGDVLRAEVREGDLAARFGGEEFAVLLPHASLEEAELIAERLRTTLAETHAQDPRSGESFTVTMSLGVAGLAPGDSVQMLLQRADDALYGAKRGGRNRVRVAAGEAPVATAA